MGRKLVLVIAVVMMFGVFAFAGCGYSALVNHPDRDKGGVVVTSDCGFFKVQTREADGYAVVFELTELGQEQEILAIPSHVKGLPVKQIGWKKGVAQNWIESEVLRKIYIPYAVDSIHVGIFGSNISECVFLPAKSEILEFKLGDGNSRVVVAKEYLQPLEEYDYYKERFVLPNLIYFYNYDNAPNLGYYWFDNITGDNLFIDPANPTREGFIFAGWFLDEDCKNEWDGVKPSSSDQKITLYAGWELK